MVTIDAKAGGMVILGNPVITGILELRIPVNGMVIIKTIEGRTLISKQLNAGSNKVGLHHLSPGTYLVVFNHEVAKILVN